MATHLPHTRVDRRLAAQAAVATHSDEWVDQASFFGAMSATIAGLVGAERVVFTRLEGDRLVGQLHGFGMDDVAVGQTAAPCSGHGHGLAELVALGDRNFRADVADADHFQPSHDLLARVHARNGLSVAWQAGDVRLGAVTVYNSTSSGGFSDEDEQVLMTAARSAGAAWQERTALVKLELQSTITANMAEGAAVVRALDGTFLYANRRFEEMFGWGQHELDDRPLTVVNAPTDRTTSETVAYIVAALQGTGSWTGETLNQRKDGSALWCRATVSTFDHPQHGRLLIIVHTDIGDLKRALAEMREARDAAELANRAKSDYLSRINHELRTPLTAIIGYTDLLLLDEQPVQARKAHEAVMKAAEHLHGLINDLLEIARIESGQQTLLLEPVLLSDLADECIGLVAGWTEASDIRLDTRLTAVTGQYVLADRQRLKQVILNLLSNALKYNRPGGRVRIAARRRAARIFLEVTDSGVGIESSLMPRLFEPFDRLGAERSQVDGTGLGLTLSRELTLAMGGTLAARSQLGAGSTFTLGLAAAKAPEVAPVDGGDGTALREASGAALLTVLYVEDNLVTVDMMEQLFALRPSWNVLTAMQGTLALQLARQYRPELIVLDVNLPDISGGEVLRLLKEDESTHDIPVVMLSAEGTASTIATMLKAGARCYVTKPVRARPFLEILDSIAASGGRETVPVSVSAAREAEEALFRRREPITAAKLALNSRSCSRIRMPRANHR